MGFIKIRLSIFILTVLFAFNCNAQRKCIGVYGDCEEHLIACRQLQLFSDSTFDYGQFLDVGGWRIKSGKWSLLGDTLILNSTEQPICFVDFSITSDFDSTLTGVKIIINPLDSIFGDIILTHLNDSYKDTIKVNSPVTIERKIDRLIIYCKNRDYNNGKILFLNNKWNVYTIATKSISLDDRRMYFKDLRLEIDKNGVNSPYIDFDWHIEKGKIITLEKVDENKRAFDSKKE